MARDFDGSADYLLYSGVPVSAYPFSLACWVYADDVSTSPFFFQFGDSASATTRAGLNFDSAGKLGAQVSSPSGTRSWYTTAGASTGVWVHCAGTFTNSSTCLSYLDGVSTGAYLGTASPAFPTLNRTSIAVMPRASLSNYLNGRVAEAAIWNTTLSQDEVSMLAAGYSPLLVSPQSLVAYWPLFGRAGAAGNEEGWVGGQVMSQTSSPAVIDHPRIIFPRRRVITPYQAAAGSLPTLTGITLSNITTSGYRATVTA